MSNSSTQAHSRDSSASSNSSLPVTPTFSAHALGLFASTSTLATAPDSPVARLSKETVPLQDLLEEPAEPDSPSDLPYEPLCICDTTFCEHRDRSLVIQSAVFTPSSPQWTSPEEDFNDADFAASWPAKRRRSGESAGPADSFTSRMSRRWPSITRRWRERRPTTSVSSSSAQGVSSWRAVSHPPSQRRSTDPMTEPATPYQTHPQWTEVPSGSADHVRSTVYAQPQPVFYSPIITDQPAENEAEPIDRRALSSTPLLPPLMTESRVMASEELCSPLQSPTIASVASTPDVKAIASALPTPPLSSKASIVSMKPTRPSHAADFSPAPTYDEDDPWASKLGHANFRISPAPYTPATNDISAGVRLLSDWEAARAEYKRQAGPIREHYGATSATYALAEAKWASLDARWQAALDAFNASAALRGDPPLCSDPASAPATSSIVPSLIADPKFPSVINADGRVEIVGHMARCAPIATSLLDSRSRKTRKPSRGRLLRIFTDPASLLCGARTHWISRR